MSIANIVAELQRKRAVDELWPFILEELKSQEPPPPNVAPALAAAPHVVWHFRERIIEEAVLRLREPLAPRDPEDRDARLLTVSAPFLCHFGDASEQALATARQQLADVVTPEKLSGPRYKMSAALFQLVIRGGPNAGSTTQNLWMVEQASLVSYVVAVQALERPLSFRYEALAAGLEGLEMWLWP